MGMVSGLRVIGSPLDAIEIKIEIEIETKNVIKTRIETRIETKIKTKNVIETKVETKTATKIEIEAGVIGAGVTTEIVRGVKVEKIDTDHVVLVESVENVVDIDLEALVQNAKNDEEGPAVQVPTENHADAADHAARAQRDEHESGAKSAIVAKNVVHSVAANAKLNESKRKRRRKHLVG